MSAVAPIHPAAAARDHFVHFYNEDEELVREVARFLRNGLQSGVGAIMIATQEHRDAVLETWHEEGFEPQAAIARGQLELLDAQETLAAFMRGGDPDPDLFDRVVGNLVRRSLDRFGDVVAFGEMVALLWQDGGYQSALDLESLWNGLAARRRFALYCAYPMSGCGVAEATESFRRVCSAHSHILPSSPVFGVSSESDQVRLLAELAQKAAALEHELARRREAEAKLAEREADLSDFFENAPMALHRVGADGTILWANRAELELLGYPPHEYIGHHIARFHADPDRIERMLCTLTSGGTLKDEPARLVCKDGTIRHVLVSSNSQVENGQFIATRCFTRDVTERWRAQEALRERAAVLHLAMQGARMGYWVADLDRDAIRLSPELASLLDVSGTSDWPLESFVGIMHPEDRAPFRRAMQDAIAQHAMLAAEFRARGTGPSWRWLEVRGEGVYEQDGRATRFYGVCADITARKARE